MALIQGKTGKPAPLPAATAEPSAAAAADGPEPMDTSDRTAVAAADAAAGVAAAGERLDSAHAGAMGVRVHHQTVTYKCLQLQQHSSSD